MVEWVIVEDVVSSDADGAVSVEVVLERLMGTDGEGVRVLHFLVLGANRKCVGFAGVNVFVYVEEGIVIHLEIYIDCVFLPLGSLLSVRL